MTSMGQQGQIDDVRVMSAITLIATKLVRRQI